MGILNKLSISEIFNAIKSQNKKLISSVPGVGPKMSERLILELKIKFQSEKRFEEENNKDELRLRIMKLIK